MDTEYSLDELLKRAKSMLDAAHVTPGATTRVVRNPRIPPNELDDAPITDYDSSRCPHCGGTQRESHMFSTTRTLHYFCKECWASWPEHGERHWHGDNGSIELHEVACWQDDEGS